MGAMSRDRANLTPLQLRLRAAATAAGMSLEEVAKAIGVSPLTLRTMGNAERSKNPNPERLLAAAEATGAPIEWIVAGWGAVVTRASLPPSYEEFADDSAALALIAEKIDAIAEDVSDLGKRQAKTDDRLRALERQ